jgi:hypothetical protein
MCYHFGCHIGGVRRAQSWSLSYKWLREHVTNTGHTLHSTSNVASLHSDRTSGEIRIIRIISRKFMCYYFECHIGGVRRAKSWSLSYKWLREHVTNTGHTLHLTSNVASLHSDRTSGDSKSFKVASGADSTAKRATDTTMDRKDTEYRHVTHAGNEQTWRTSHSGSDS